MLSSGLSPRIGLLGGASLLASCAAIAVFASGSSAESKRSPVAGARATASAVVRAAANPKAACSKDMVLAGQSCIDRYEGHLLEEGPGGTLVLHPPHERPDRKRYVAESSAGIKPQAFICQVDAAAACENAGKRLCSLSEWYRRLHRRQNGTCTLTDATLPKGSLQRRQAAPAVDLHGASASNWSYADFNDPELRAGRGFLALSGAYPGCATPAGVYGYGRQPARMGRRSRGRHVAQ